MRRASTCRRLRGAARAFSTDWLEAATGPTGIVTAARLTLVTTTDHEDRQNDEGRAQRVLQPAISHHDQEPRRNRSGSRSREGATGNVHSWRSDRSAQIRL